MSVVDVQSNLLEAGQHRELIVKLAWRVTHHTLVAEISEIEEKLSDGKMCLFPCTSIHLWLMSAIYDTLPSNHARCATRLCPPNAPPGLKNLVYGQHDFSM